MRARWNRSRYKIIEESLVKRWIQPTFYTWAEKLKYNVSTRSVLSSGLSAADSKNECVFVPYG